MHLQCIWMKNILPHLVAYTNVAKRICAFAFLSALSSLLFPLEIVKLKKVKLLHCWANHIMQESGFLVDWSAEDKCLGLSGSMYFAIKKEITLKIKESNNFVQWSLSEGRPLGYHVSRNWTRFRQIDQMYLPEIEFWAGVFHLNIKLWANNFSNLRMNSFLDFQNYDFIPCNSRI